MTSPQLNYSDQISLATCDGVGIDFTAEMVRGTARHHPDLLFLHAGTLSWFAFANLLVDKPLPAAPPTAGANRPLVSVVVTARNEAGNIDAIIRRVPAMGSHTEIVFVEGGSTADTYATIEASLTPDYSGS